MANMTTANLLPRPGYSLYTCNSARQNGRRVLRADWIEMGEMRRLGRGGRAWEEAIQGEDETRLQRYFSDLARIVPAWEFTDREGKPLPQPEQDSSVFDRLDDETMRWLLGNEEGQLLADLFPKAPTSAP